MMDGVRGKGENGRLKKEWFFGGVRRSRRI